MTTSDKVPHDDFAEGFKVGFRSCSARTTPLLSPTVSQALSGGMTPFLMGVRAGIEAAQKTLTKQTEVGPPIGK